MKAIALFCSFVVTLVPCAAQSAAQLKQELSKKEAASAKDADALFATGQWAAEKALPNDAKRIFQAVLKMKPDHEGANLAVGNELVEGKWLAAKDAEALRKKAQAAEFAAQGLVEVSGVWVEKEQVDDAKRGVFHHGGELVTKEEKVALLAGKVRHPDTGELIDPKHAEQASKRYFPVGGGRWVDEKEADTYHSDPKRSWIVRTQHCALVSTMPIAKLLELRSEADRAVETVQPILGSPPLHPKKRPVVIVAATQSEFRELGNGLGDETSSSGAWLTREGVTVELPIYGGVKAAVCWNDKDWGTRYLRHAAALAFVHAATSDAGQLPLWLQNGIAARTSRFHTPEDYVHFGKQHVGKGGVRGLKGFFSGFAINGEMDPKDIDANIFQAGLLIHFAERGEDPAVAEALKELNAALVGPKPKKGVLDKLVAKLETAFIAAEPAIAAYLQKLVG